MYPNLGDGAIERRTLEDTQLATGAVKAGPHKKGVEHRHVVYAHITWITATTKAYYGWSASLGS